MMVTTADGDAPTDGAADGADPAATHPRRAPASSCSPAAGRGWVRAADGDAQVVFRDCGGGLADAERRAGADQCSKLVDLGSADSASYRARLPRLERISQASLMRRICWPVSASACRSGGDAWPVGDRHAEPPGRSRRAGCRRRRRDRMSSGSSAAAPAVREVTVVRFRGHARGNSATSVDSVIGRSSKSG